MSSSSFSLSALLTSKAAGVAAAAVVVAGGGAAAATAASGSPNPANWGATVTQAVAACKASAARTDTNGIGACVSAIAKQHGAQERALHSHASEARSNHPDATDNPGESKRPSPGSHPTGQPSGTGNGNSGSHGQSGSHKP